MGGDLATFNGSVRMLDYLAQKTMILYLVIHIKDARMGLAGNRATKSAVLVEASPQPLEHAVWRKLDGIADGFAMP